MVGKAYRIVASPRTVPEEVGTGLWIEFRLWIAGTSYPRRVRTLEAYDVPERPAERLRHHGPMWIGSVEFDLLLGDVHSLKTKRGLVRPLVRELRSRFEVAAAEVGHLELHRRAAVGSVCVAADRAHVVAVLDAVERFVAGRPELELLSAHRELRTNED